MTFFKNLSADILPNDKFSSSDVVEIQLMSLQSNSENDDGIYQCWIFAHPENKKYTGPFKYFSKMIKILLNSQKNDFQIIKNIHLVDVIVTFLFYF